MAEKLFILKSIVKSKLIIGVRCVKGVIGKVSIPSMLNIADKSLEELRNLKIVSVSWGNTATLAFTLTDGQSCKAGTYNFNNYHTFDPAKKITKIECII